MRAARMLAPYGEALPVLGETAAPVEPGEGPFDYPSFWQHDEPLGVIRTLDDLHIHPGHDVLHGVAEVRSPVSAIGMKLPQERVQPEQGRHQHRAAVAVLNVSRVHDRLHQQACGIDHNMALLPFGLLPGVIPMRVDAGAAFFRAFYTLAIDHSSGRAGFSVGQLAASHIECVTDPLQRSGIDPAVEVVMDRAAWWQVLRPGFAVHRHIWGCRYRASVVDL